MVPLVSMLLTPYPRAAAFTPKFMKFSQRLRFWLALTAGLPLASQATDIIKTWTGAGNNALNNVANWDNNTRPTFGATANTDALIFAGAGTGIINVNVDATAKSISVSGDALGYTFQGASQLRLGDTFSGTTQPNSGLFINNSTQNLALTTTGGVFFSFGRLEAAAGTISVGGGSFLDIGNGAATAGRNLTIAGAQAVTVNGLLAGLGTQVSAGGHLIKEGANVLSLNGSSATWNGRIFINEGTVRINRATALGSAVGDTTLGGGDSTARLELSGGIAVDETLVVAGRNSATAPLLVNVAGDNILTSPLLLNAGGTEYGVESQAGTLTLQGDVDYGTSSGTTTLHVGGAGNGVVSGALGAGGDLLGVVKAGTGTWSLTGANAFVGPVSVQAGRLNLTTAHVAQNAITVAEGGTLGVVVSTPAKSVNATSLSVTGTAGTTALDFDVGSLGNPSVPLLKTPSLTVTGVVGVALKGGGLSIGQIPLIDYDGTIGGAGFAGLTLTEVPARVTAALVEDVANGRVVLNVTGFDVPRWTGEVDANWDLNDGTGTGTANWRERNSGSLTHYFQTPTGRDAVVFDDTATGSTQVLLTASLSPSSVTVDNTTKEYSFGGVGGLDGNGSLVKKGAGTLLLINGGASTLAGGVSIEAGTIRVGDGLTAAAGSLGNGPVANAGSLIFNRPDAYTFAGAISGAGSITKLGAGVTTLSGNSNFTSETQILEGTLRLGNANALGETAGGTTVASGASLDVNGQLLPQGEVVTIIGKGVGDTGAVVNTGASGAGVGLKQLVLAGPASIGGVGRWDIRDQPGGLNAHGHDFTKTGTNVVQLYNIGETHLGNIAINGPGSRLTFSGDTTVGDRPGNIRIEAGAQLGLEESTVPITKQIFTELGTINATGGTTNVISSTITLTTGLTVNSAAATEIVLAGKITGTGDLVKTTGGIVKITNDHNDYTGTTTISTGPFWIGNDGPTGNLPAGEVINNGNLIFRRTGEHLVFSQTISGTGQLTFPAGTTGDDYVVTLAGNNSFNGNVTVARALVKVIHNTSLGVTLPPSGEGQPAPTKLITVANARRPSLLLDPVGEDIVLPPTLLFATSSDGPLGAIVNVKGNNVIQGGIDLTNGGGGNTRIRVSGGTLTLAGPVRSAPAATSARGLLLDGDGATGIVNGVLSTGGPFALTVSKLGTGTWVLNAANTYTGSTTISAGTLKLGATGSILTSPNIDLTAGAIFDVADVTGGYALGATQALRGSGSVQGSVTLPTGSTLNPGTVALPGTLDISQDLTFNGGRLLVNLAAVATEGAGINDLVNIGRDVIVAAPSALEIAATGSRPAGTYRLANYTGTLTGAGNLTVVNPTRYTAALDVSAPGQINLVIGGSNANLVWSGNATGNVWNRTVTDAWNGGTDIFYQSDAVVFDDTAAPANTTVTLGEVVTPSSVIVSAAQNYTFSGTGSIGGTTGLTKSGTGTLTINTANAFTGKVKISGGSIVLGSAGRFNGTHWIEVDQGAVLDVQAITAGFTLGGNIVESRVLSGRGTLIGNYIINSAGVVKPGDSSLPDDILTAGDGIGSLSFTGNLTLSGAAAAGSPRAVLRLTAPTGTVPNSLDSASVAAFSTTSPAGHHDHLQVGGILALDAGGTIRIELASGYAPALGDVFNIADWGTLNLNADAAGLGFDVALAADLELPELPEGLYWNRSLFATDGLLYISPEPPVLGSIQVSPAATVNPGTSVTLSIEASGLEPYTYQWKRNGQDIALATSASYTFNAAEADEGSYTVVVTNPAGPTTSAAVAFVVNNPVVITRQPVNQTFVPGVNVTFEVEATGTGPITYQWRKNGIAIPDAVTSTLPLSGITEADQASYDVIVTGAVGPVTSAAGVLTVHDPVVITRQPAAQGAILDGSATFSVEFTGTGPFTYRWSKDGVELPVIIGSSAQLTLSNVTEDDIADYSVQITGIVGTVTSQAARLHVVDDVPEVISITPHRLVGAGTPVTLSVYAVGRPPVSYQWFKGTAKVANATSPQLQIASAQVKDAGAYRVEVVAAGSAPVSGAVEVGVVETAAKTVTVADGGTVKLDVKLAGTGLVPKWSKDGAPLDDAGRISGSGTAVLNIAKPLEEGDSGLYTLTVTGPGGSITTAGHQLNIFTDAPIIVAPVFPAAIVGGDFVHEVEVDDEPTRAPTAFAAAGLPPGLKIDAKTGRIAGKPTAVSKDPLGYLVKLTVSNAKGKATADGRLIVQALPENAIGTFAGVIGRHPLTQNLGGKLELVVAKTGAYTGKLFLGTGTYALKGALVITPAVGGTASTQSGVASIVRKGLSTLTFEFSLDAPNNRIATAKVKDGDAELAFTGWRNKWSKTTSAVTEFGAYHTFALGTAATWHTDARVPQGDGYGTFTIAADGKLNIVGKLADGEALTNAGFVSPSGEIVVFKTLYKTVEKGSVAGALDINAPDLVGSLTWSRPATPSDKHRLYREGFPEVLTLTAAGGQYIAPVSPQVFLSLELVQGKAAADLLLNSGGLESYVENEASLTLRADILVKSKAVLPANATANPRKPTLTLTEKTGLFKGGFNLENANPLPSGKPALLKQAVKFEGVAIRENGEYRGAGFFLLNQLPTEAAPVTTPTLSGQVSLEKVEAN